MSAKFFVDTNILVYAYDRSEPRKQHQALALMDALVTGGLGAISVQVLSEFFVVVTRKLPEPLSVSEAYDRIEQFLRFWPVCNLTGMVALEAARGVRDHQLSFWDAQIWAAARLNQIHIVLSEDFNSGQVIEGVRFINPFDETFRLHDWLKSFY